MNIHYLTTNIRILFQDSTESSEINYTKTINGGLLSIWHNNNEIEILKTGTYNGRFMINNRKTSNLFESFFL